MIRKTGVSSTVTIHMHCISINLCGTSRWPKQYPAGVRVHIDMSGKFLPCKSY
jgi:hypothetical protein